MSDQDTGDNANEETAADTADKPEISDGDKMRAGIYGLLGVLLTEAPDPEQMIQVAGLRSNPSPLGEALGALAKTALANDPASVALEFKTLFGSIMKPVASAHVADKDAAMAALIAENERLGITPFDDAEEPIDHIAALCDTMASLILSQHNTPLTPEDHKRFFNAHIAPWAEGFFTKLEGKRTAKFYGPVGAVGRAFMADEVAANTLPA